MQISATINSTLNQNIVTVKTNETAQEIKIAAKATGFGSAVNGGELLLLALATCFCNDLYREAKKRNLSLASVSVVATGEFGGEGEPGFNFQYKAHVVSDAPREAIEELIAHTDRVAEIHNTLRKGLSVKLISKL